MLILVLELMFKLFGLSPHFKLCLISNPNLVIYVRECTFLTLLKWLNNLNSFSNMKVYFSAGLDFDIRLTNGTESSGRVEVKINNQWGTICGTDFTKNEALVICKQLGYFDGVALAAGNHGGGSGEVTLTGMTCTGKETTLKDCVWSGYRQTSGLCDHSKDAAVRCYTNCEFHCSYYYTTTSL